jgi:hypothetical protein
VSIAANTSGAFPLTVRDACTRLGPKTLTASPVSVSGTIDRVRSSANA